MGQVVVQGVVDAAALNLPREGRRSEALWGSGSYLRQLVSQDVNKGKKKKKDGNKESHKATKLLQFESHCLEQRLTRRKNPLSFFWRNLTALVAIWVSEGDPAGLFTRSTSNGTCVSENRPVTGEEGLKRRPHLAPRVKSFRLTDESRV